MSPHDPTIFLSVMKRGSLHGDQLEKIESKNIQDKEKTYIQPTKVLCIH